MYTLEQIKKAYWKTFHKSGEIWFNYLMSVKQNQEPTEEAWKHFLICLEEILEEDNDET